MDSFAQLVIVLAFIYWATPYITPRRRPVRPPERARVIGRFPSTPGPERQGNDNGDNGNANDNNAVIREILALREEAAKLLGYESFAAYRLEDSMAKTPEAVRGLLERVWKPARAQTLRDRDELQALVAEDVDEDGARLDVRQGELDPSASGVEIVHGDDPMVLPAGAVHEHGVVGLVDDFEGAPA